MPHDIRDELIDFVRYWTNKTEKSATHLVKKIGITRSKYYDWIDRYGLENRHGTYVPRDSWILPEERQAIIDYHRLNPLNGYRRLAFMMIDSDVVCVSPKTVYRVLKMEGVLDKSTNKSSLKGTGFKQPLKPHQHWHIDVSYINICGTFFYLCSILDGFSRFIVHWELKESMKEKDIEIIIQKGLEKYPGSKPRIISDNGPQFVSRDFKKFVSLAGMDHVRTSPYYPQSNGKIERWHKELKQSCIRARRLDSYEAALTAVEEFVDEYNNTRLHAAIGYITPKDKMLGRAEEVQKMRDERLETARRKRKLKWQSMTPMEKISAGGYGYAEEQPERLQITESKDVSEAA